MQHEDLPGETALNGAPVGERLDAFLGDADRVEVVPVAAVRAATKTSPEQLHPIDWPPGLYPLLPSARTFKTGVRRITQAGNHRSNLRSQMKLMHDPAQLIAFVTFAAVVAGTPGPSNVLLTAIGARAGFRHGLPSLLGQVTGMGVMLFATTLGLGSLLLAHPLALQILRRGSGAVLDGLADRDRGATRSGHGRPEGLRPDGGVPVGQPQGMADRRHSDRHLPGPARRRCPRPGRRPRDRVYAGRLARLPSVARVRRGAAAFPADTTRVAHPQRRHGGPAGGGNDPL